MPKLSKKEAAKRKGTVKAAAKRETQREGCSFPSDDAVGNDIRHFSPGEIVCLRNIYDYVLPARFVRREGQSQIEVVYSQGMVSVSVPWVDVGKFTSTSTRLGVAQLARQRNVPEDIERHLLPYMQGGRGTTRRRRRRGTRR